LGRRDGNALILILAAGLITGIGGGIIRDLLFIGRLPVAVTEPGMTAMALLGSLIGLLLAEKQGRAIEAAVDTADFVAVGLTGVLGFVTAHRLAPHADPAVINCVTALVTMVTACGGGIVRDVCLRKAPFAFSGCYLLLCLSAGPIHFAMQSVLAPWAGINQLHGVWPFTAVVVAVIGMLTRDFRFARS
jgi:uncharacterized membrane protein YeiH